MLLHENIFEGQVAMSDPTLRRRLIQRDNEANAEWQKRPRYLTSDSSPSQEPIWKSVHDQPKLSRKRVLICDEADELKRTRKEDTTKQVSTRFAVVPGQSPLLAWPISDPTPASQAVSIVPYYPPVFPQAFAPLSRCTIEQLDSDEEENMEIES